MGEHDARESTYRVPPVEPANGFDGLQLSIARGLSSCSRRGRVRHGWCC